MSSAFARRLRELAAQDPAVAPLALLQAEALDATGDPAWSAAVPVFSSEPPQLHGALIRLDVERVRELFQRLGTEVSGPLAVLRASLCQEEVSEQALAVIAQVASLPLLLACGAAAAPHLKDVIWPHGYCPVCAAWPTLLEVRGLERQRWLRCGRCGSGWAQINALCAFCGTDEYRSQGYLAPEAERESRQALTCQRCRGYLKAFTTLGPLDPGEVLLRDLQSLELDVAALDQGYARPAEPAVRLSLRLEPLSASVSSR